MPAKITIDKSGANTAAIESIKADACLDILMRKGQMNYPAGSTASAADQFYGLAF